MTIAMPPLDAASVSRARLTDPRLAQTFGHFARAAWGPVARDVYACRHAPEEMARLLSRHPSAWMRVKAYLRHCDLIDDDGDITLDDVLQRLGPNLADLVLLSDLMSALNDLPSVRGFSLARFRTQSMQVALMTAEQADDVDRAFAAGLLHGVGELILAHRYAPQMEEAYETSVVRDLPLAEVERTLVGMDHHMVGAYVLRERGVDATVVDAVACQSDTPREEPLTSSALARQVSMVRWEVVAGRGKRYDWRSAPPQTPPAARPHLASL